LISSLCVARCHLCEPSYMFICRKEIKEGYGENHREYGMLINLPVGSHYMINIISGIQINHDFKILIY
jgi:hypothetical protein